MENFNFNNSNSSSTSASIPSFSSFKNKDGSESFKKTISDDKKKTRIDEIIDIPVTITKVSVGKSRYEEGKEYLVLEYTNPDGEECYTTTSSSGIRSALDNKGDNVVFPCKATVVRRASKSHPGWKYLTLE